MAEIAQGCYASAAGRFGIPVGALPMRWNLPLFVHFVADLLTLLNEKGATLILHLEGVEWLRHFEDSGRILAALQRLPFFANQVGGAEHFSLRMPLQVLLEARVPPENLFDPVERSCSPDFVLFFPPYDRAALRNLLLARRCQTQSSPSPGTGTLEAGCPSVPDSCTEAFVSTLLDVLHDLTNDFAELCFWSDVLFPFYARGWRARQGRTASIASAYTACLPYFKEAIKRIYTRSSILLNESIELQNAHHEAPPWRIMLCKGSRVSKALLLAGYFAARIPPSHDRKLFETNKERQGCQKRRRRYRARLKEACAIRPFSVERLYRIRHYILQRYTDQEQPGLDLAAFYRTAPLGSVLSNLICHGFFSKVTRSHAVERQRLRCYVSRELAQDLAREVGIALEDYVSNVQ
ncbi:hypothetical protein CCYA_CCYA07G2068 [Cyanidiococcus yangmingshanensis]|nr:hypothetical protein CCYA_CCYA07G2068 [Cyanidiococcus yangmingshanensis]